MPVPASLNWPGLRTSTVTPTDSKIVYYCAGNCSSLWRACQAEQTRETLDLASAPDCNFTSHDERTSNEGYAFIFALAVLAATPSLADNMPVNADGLTWGPAPPVLPKGAQFAVLSGYPSKDGLYVLRLKMPANYKIPAHNHPTSEYVTIISGKFHIGMGDKLDEQKGVELRAGGFGEAPAHMNYYAWASEETVVQGHGQGPFAITYVNPAHDPATSSLGAPMRTQNVSEAVSVGRRRPSGVGAGAPTSRKRN